jgi:predicted nucleic acid-binding Zn ribbon protein
MPLYEYVCQNPTCTKHHVRVERYLPRMSSPDPPCVGCGHDVKKVPSVSNIVFTGVMTARYNDPKKEYSHQEGQWASRVKSTTRADGKPEPVFLETFEDMSKHCKAEGLVNPKDTPAGVEITADGRGFKNTSGNPGQWI